MARPHPLFVRSLPLALLCALAACSGGPGAPPARRPTVSVVTLSSQPYTRTTALPGRTTAFLTAPVTPQVSGIIQKRLFEEGSEVKAGQLLYQIDPAPYQASYDSAKGDLAKARAALLSARPLAERDQALAKLGAISQEDLETAQATLQQDEAAVASAQAALETARINLGYTRITAPISGTISASTYTPGALVTADQSTALATIYAYDPMYVDVTQSSSQVLALRKALAAGTLRSDPAGGAKIRLTLEDGSTYAQEGRLQFAGVAVTETTGTITLRAIVPNPDKLLLPGMYVHAVVEQGVQPRALLVPQQAVTRNSKGEPVALIVDAQDKVQQRVLTVDGTSGSNWVVQSGLAAGDRVVVEGSQNVSEGSTVTVKAFQPASSSSTVQPAGAGSAD